jgi:hypothetical protein
MLKILKDAEGRHDVFLPFGAIALEQIESWMRSSSLNIPRDLVEFWSQTGGGDLFDDSETILRPTQIPSIYPGFVDGDHVDSATRCRIQHGMPDSYLLFHEGPWLSAVRLPDQMFVTLDARKPRFLQRSRNGTYARYERPTANTTAYRTKAARVKKNSWRSDSRPPR